MAPQTRSKQLRSGDAPGRGTLNPKASLNFTPSRRLSVNLDPSLASHVKSEKVQSVAGSSSAGTSKYEAAPENLDVALQAIPNAGSKIMEESGSDSIKSTKFTSSKRPKKHPYGLTPGLSPFPDHLSPTVGDCRKVNELLASMHGAVTQPTVIPPPSSTVTGCGEVPDLLDALLRTLLSANTSSENSAKALAGLIETFGSSGGSPSWDVVRQASVKQVEDAIAAGGQQKNKSKFIKGILDLVYQQNFEIYQKLSASIDGEVPAKADFNFLSLARIFTIKDTNEAMDELLKFPGIGVKTASCVILFCMQRPSFAVDTHVSRISQWLGWVPAGSTEDKIFSHLEVRVPDELKYALHHLFIKHGRHCFRCRANTNPSTSGWDDCGCPIEDLVTRTGKMKEVRGASSKSTKSAHKKVQSGRVKKSKSAKLKGKKNKKNGNSEESEDVESVVSDESNDED